MRIWLAIKCFFLILFARRLPDDAAALLPKTQPGRLPPPEAEIVDAAITTTVPGSPALDSTQPMTQPELAKATQPQASQPASAPQITQTQPSAQPKPDGNSAVQLLAIFQREGRLLDFLQEDVDAYSDAQIGAAVRDIHRGCKKALAEHLPLEPVLREPENAQVRVDPGFDPSRIRLVGNVVGEPPFTGALRHHGWRVSKIALPTVKAADPTVVAPAEVELT